MTEAIKKIKIVYKCKTANARVQGKKDQNTLKRLRLNAFEQNMTKQQYADFWQAFQAICGLVSRENNTCVLILLYSRIGVHLSVHCSDKWRVCQVFLFFHFPLKSAFLASCISHGYYDWTFSASCTRVNKLLPKIREKMCFKYCNHLCMGAWRSSLPWGVTRVQNSNFWFF